MNDDDLYCWVGDRRVNSLYFWIFQESIFETLTFYKGFLTEA